MSESMSFDNQNTPAPVPKNLRIKVLFLSIIGISLLLIITGLFIFLNYPNKKILNESILPAGKARGPEKQIIVGEIKNATQTSFSIIPLSNKKQPLTFAVYKDSIFEQSSASISAKTYSFEQFKKNMVNLTNHLVKVNYFYDGFKNLAYKVTFFE